MGDGVSLQETALADKVVSILQDATKNGRSILVLLSYRARERKKPRTETSAPRKEA
jgi:hypothetical protein